MRDFRTIPPLSLITVKIFNRICELWLLYISPKPFGKRIDVCEWGYMLEIEYWVKHWVRVSLNSSLLRMLHSVGGAGRLNLQGSWGWGGCEDCSILFLTPGIPLEDGGSWFSGRPSKDWFWKGERKIVASSNTITFVAGRLFLKWQCIFRFLYSSAQAKEPDIGCLLLLESQSRILREQSLVVSVHLSKCGQNDSEPGGWRRIRIN